MNKDRVIELEDRIYQATRTMILWFGVSNILFGCLFGAVALELFFDVGSRSVTHMSIIGFGLLGLIFTIYKYQMAKETYDKTREEVYRL